MVSVALWYTCPQTFSAPYSLENLIKHPFSLRISPEPKTSHSLCLISGHKSDIAQELSVSVADRVLVYL